LAGFGEEEYTPMNGSLSALAVGGAMLAVFAGPAQARGRTAEVPANVTLVRLTHEQGARAPWPEGRILEFNDLTSGMAVPYDLAFNGGCPVYGMKWYQTGRRYWLRRYADCREG
jgi:hypothetical protein